MSNTSDVISYPLPCIVCGKQLEPVFGDSSINQPSGGLVFHAQGTYGSSFDPMRSDLALLVTICDSCIDSKSAEHKVLLQKTLPVIPPVENYFWGTDEAWEQAG